VERKKILPLTLMFFCMLFNYTILRDTKDVLVVTAPGSGTCVFSSSIDGDDGPQCTAVTD
jgi:ATP/ADP translocase